MSARSGVSRCVVAPRSISPLQNWEERDVREDPEEQSLEPSISDDIRCVVMPRPTSLPAPTYSSERRSCLDKNGSDNPGIIALSGTGTPRPHAEKRWIWFRVWVCVLKKSLTSVF